MESGLKLQRLLVSEEEAAAAAKGLLHEHPFPPPQFNKTKTKSGHSNFTFHNCIISKCF
jgi:hypothetical protein